MSLFDAMRRKKILNAILKTFFHFIPLKEPRSYLFIISLQNYLKNNMM